MLGTAHGSLWWGWGRQSWSCWAASLTGLPGGPGSPCRETDVTASPFPRDPCHPTGTPLALTFSPRGPVGPGAPCGEIRDVRGLAVPGNHPEHSSSGLHSSTATTRPHLSA